MLPGTHLTSTPSFVIGRFTPVSTLLWIQEKAKAKFFVFDIFRFENIRKK
jgi:hypothetical protein